MSRWDHYCPVCKQWLFNGELCPLVLGKCKHCGTMIRWDDVQRDYVRAAKDEMAKDLVDEAIAAVEFTLGTWSGDEPPERGSCVEVLQRMVVEVERLRQDVELYEAMKDGVQIRIAGLDAEIERLRALCLASFHLLKGADTVYDPRGDTGPTHWLSTRDKLLPELAEAEKEE